MKCENIKEQPTLAASEMGKASVSIEKHGADISCADAVFIAMEIGERILQSSGKISHTEGIYLVSEGLDIGISGIIAISIPINAHLVVRVA